MVSSLIFADYRLFDYRLPSDGSMSIMIESSVDYEFCN
ncbi:hypothetical protein SynBIOSE41_03899 [Synechococcus sp. BIOS-E4-1]|nr:hypothetical protein SynBIOSE41_03899 [Synechococcus sp. BIOS-E4-1]